MAKRIHRDTLILALERRFDHLSAQTILTRSIAMARIGDKDDFTVEEVSRLAWVLRSAEERVDAAAEALMEAVSFAASGASGAPMVEPDPDADPSARSELDEDPEWERIDLAAIPALLQDVVNAAVQSHQVSRAIAAKRRRSLVATKPEEPEA